MESAISNLVQGRLGEAEAIARRQLQVQPGNVAALCLLADIAARAGIYPEAVRLFREALRYLPAFNDARLNLARLLSRTTDAREALSLLNEILATEPDNIDAATLRLSLLGQIGEYDETLGGYGQLASRHPDLPSAWLGLANVAKTLGQSDVAIAGYRRALQTGGNPGDSWWGLANLKTFRFAAQDIAAMEATTAASPDPQIRFALGKAYEDAGDDARAFACYAAGNTLHRRQNPYDPQAIRAEVDRSIAFFTPALIAKPRTTEMPAVTPIFIVGMPRAGSTLVEQILASHPSIEGTSELPYAPMLVHQLLAERWREHGLRFPDMLRGIVADRLNALGEEYLAAAAIHRKSDRPYFIDKLPNNWAYIGFIRMILPNARIIDARRGAMACCFANYKQHFARGQAFAYGLADLGSYYRDYVRLMQHFDDAAPGMIHRLQHEKLLADPEGEIRGMLDYLGLPFDPACLHPERNNRPVRTASSEQVRRPISAEAADRWKRFSPWLDDLREALGPLAEE